MNEIHKLYKKNYAKLTKTEKRIAEFVSKNPKKLITLSALELGKELGVSDASVLRFSKNIGFNKFSDFKNYVALELSEGNLNERIVKNWNNFTSENDLANKIINADLRNIQDFLLNIDFELIERLIDLIEKSKKIYILGIGASRAIAQFMFWHIKRLGYSSECIIEGGFGLYETISKIKKEELLILFAFPKFLNDEINTLKVIKEKRAKSVVITSSLFSEISFLGDIVFRVPIQNNAFLNSYMVPMEFCNIVLTSLFEKNKEKIYEEWKKNSNIKKFLFVQED